MDWNWLIVTFWFPIEHKLHWQFLNTQSYSTWIWLRKINPFYERYILNSFYRQRGTEYAAWAACHSSCSSIVGALPCSISWWTAQKIISCHLCSKIIPTVGMNKSREVCLFLLLHRLSTKMSNGNTSVRSLPRVSGVCKWRRLQQGWDRTGREWNSRELLSFVRTLFPLNFLGLVFQPV